MNIDITLKDYSKVMKRWLFDPVLWCREVVGMYQEDAEEESGFNYILDPLQKEIFINFAKLCRLKEKKAYRAILTEAEELAVHKIGVSVQSSKGVGKTGLAALIGLWFFCCYKDARVVIMGPKYDQIKKNLWPEITKWIGISVDVYGEDSILNQIIERQSDKMYMKQQTKAKLGEKWVMFILTFPKNSSIEDQMVAVQGQHDDNMLFLMDESSGIPDHIFEPIEATLTSKKGPNVVFAIFNPNKTRGWALDTQTKMKSKWVTHHIDHFKSSLSSNEVESYMKLKYGINSNKYRVSILGLPPLHETDALIPWDWIQEAKERWLDYILDPSELVLKAADIGAGGDKSILCTRIGYKVMPYKENTSADTNVVGNWITRDFNELSPYKGYIDMNGVGNKVFHDIKATKLWKVVGINQGRASREPGKYKLLGDELKWLMRQSFEEGYIAIPPDDDELEGELSLLKYDDSGSGGTIKVVSKQNTEYKKEMQSLLGYKSPNKADSLSFTFYDSYSIMVRSKKKMNMIGITEQLRKNKSTLKRAWMSK